VTGVRRGFFRLWIVATVCWIGFVVLLLLAAVISPDTPWQNVAFAIAPPAIVYIVVFLVIPWIADGFRKKN
jgi:hypothetical protein